MFDWLREGSCTVHLRGGDVFWSWEDVKLNLDVLSRPSYGLEFCFVVLVFVLYLNQLSTERNIFSLVSWREFLGAVPTLGLVRIG